MDAATLDVPRVPLWRCHLLEARNEFLRLLRAPSFALPTLLFPPMFYLLFAVLFERRGGFEANLYLLATYGVFGVMSPGLFGFGVTVALDRERGWLALKRALPMPPGAYLASKLAMAMLFATIIFAILAVLAMVLGGVRLPAGAWLSLYATELFGVLPFCALGLWLGTVASGQAAPAIANLLYLPMSFLSGLWMPLTVLPAFVAKIAPLWPAWHLGRLALAAVGQAPGEALLPHVAALAAFGLAFVALARRRLARG
ncbi:ABC transporter permease [Dokdonella fugitiva]|jgi:ABC-2 type transport system permease protein|uniref:ABC-2 type transport system permease protein n=1 Tax=Dokdonella fugitiva TaxID=328517 RepID=A0A4R2I497_9GAMM|nr:ABC transporter permease [Dokdonella fugitiva]MBA8884041.1 ABC-2 type transport system permease protein [Dokdonella fugitiva]TCO38737.1 ABC-2 type transport system permease protein [Dokdonella fugitiva]